MNIVILGTGGLGSYLATALSNEQHNVTLIDQDAHALEKFAQSADVATIVGSGSNWTLLEDQLEGKPDYFIAMTGCDEINLIACGIAKKLGYPTVIARVSAPSFLDFHKVDCRRLLFIDHILAPEINVAQDLFRNVTNIGAIYVENFAHGAIQMRTIIIPDAWNEHEKTLAEINFPGNVLVGVIRRKSSDKSAEEQIIFPRGDDQILPGDEVTFFGETKLMLELADFFKIKTKQVRSAVILGGSIVTLHLARALNDQNIAVKILEEDEQRCQDLSEKIPFATILNHDMTDLNFYRSENFRLSEVFIAASDFTSTNILASTLAQEVGCEDVITLVSETNFSVLLNRLGITYVVSERMNVTNDILSIVYGEEIVSVTSIYEHQVKIIELKVKPDTKITGMQIMDFGELLPKECVIALIEHQGEVMVAKGMHIIAPEDTLILITAPKHIQELEQLF